MRLGSKLMIKETTQQFSEYRTAVEPEPKKISQSKSKIKENFHKSYDVWLAII